MKAIKVIIVLLVCLTLILSASSAMFLSITIPSSGRISEGPSDLPPMGTTLIETSFENEVLSENVFLAYSIYS